MINLSRELDYEDLMPESAPDTPIKISSKTESFEKEVKDKDIAISKKRQCSEMSLDGNIDNKPMKKLNEYKE